MIRKGFVISFPIDHGGGGGEQTAAIVTRRTRIRQMKKPA
jgi:hypothetical protein